MEKKKREFDPYPPCSIHIDGHEVPTYQTVFEKEVKLKKLIKRNSIIAAILSFVAVMISIAAILWR